MQNSIGIRVRSNQHCLKVRRSGTALLRRKLQKKKNGHFKYRITILYIFTHPKEVIFVKIPTCAYYLLFVIHIKQIYNYWNTCQCIPPKLFSGTLVHSLRRILLLKVLALFPGLGAAAWFYFLCNWTIQWPFGLCISQEVLNS